MSIATAASSPPLPPYRSYSDPKCRCTSRPSLMPSGRLPPPDSSTIHGASQPFSFARRTTLGKVSEASGEMRP